MRKLFFTIYQQILRLYVATFKIKKTEIIHAPGAATDLGAVLKKDGINHVLVITDAVLMKLKLLEGLFAGLKKSGISYVVYSDVVPNPTVQNVEEAKALFLQDGCKAIVAFGGGSVIDCAKMVGVVALTRKPVHRYNMMIPLIPKMARLYAVPTTAGTGSEVTLSAIITDESKRKKMGITDVKLVPDVAVLDAELMSNLPKHVLAGTGMDALTHAVEAYVGNWKFKETDKNAVKATQTVFKYLKRAYDDESDIEARHQMAIGATYGGYAFRTGGVGYVHGIAHRLSELYGVPHGMANAMVLPHVLKHGFNTVYKKLAHLSIEAGLAERGLDEKAIAQDFIARIKQLNAHLSIPKTVDVIRRGDIPLMSKRAVSECNKTYPVPNVMDTKQMEALIESLMPHEETTNKEEDIAVLERQIAATVQNQKAYFKADKTLSYAVRKASLKRLKTAVQAYEPKIAAALKADLGKHAFEAFGTEVSIVYTEINHALKHLKSWMKAKRVPTPLVSFGGVSKIHKQPRGTVLIMTPWNYPFMLAVAPVVAALAAGNTVVLKPSFYSPHTSAVIQEMVAHYFDADVIAVFQGNRQINAMLLDQSFDFIFFTGSVKVGKIVMQQASQNLTPVLLEMGGKSPCIVDATADLKKAAKRIVWGKCINAGQSCIAPDYVLVEQSVKDALVAEMIKAKQQFFGDDMLTNDNFGSMIRKAAYDGLLGLLDGQKVLHGGASDADKLKIALTLLDEPALSSPVMQQEIFGPILPIIGVADMDEAIGIVRQYEKPLALYLFSRNNAHISRVLKTVHFGGGCINDTMMHIANSNLPFGGVGQSGMGAYHADHGFNAFTHNKSVIRQNFLLDIPIKYPPYKNKIKLLKKIVK